MIDLTIDEIREVVGGSLVGGDPAATVGGSVQTDSRLVTRGSIFFALRGDETDGHLFADKAAANEAALIIAERSLDVAVPVIVVADGVVALAALAAHVVARVRATGTLSVVAVTGSNGKTTTKNLLNAILSDVGPTVAPIESFNNHVGAPISMLRITAQTRYLVVEMGASHLGEIAYLSAICEPDIAVVLKVGLAHVGEFGGIETTQRAKSEIVVNLPPSAVAVLNADDHRVAAMHSLTEARVRWFGRGASRVSNVVAGLQGTAFTAHIGDAEVDVSLRIVGEHHVMNALAALAVADELGLDLARAATSIAGVQRAERWRMELLTTPAGATVFNDAYNASPDSMDAALRTIASLTPEGRSVAVLGEMTELGAESEHYHAQIGALVAELDYSELIVVGEPARAAFTAAARETAWKGGLVFVESPERAEELLERTLGAGDVVLIKSSKSANLRFVGDRLARVGA